MPDRTVRWLALSTCPGLGGYGMGRLIERFGDIDGILSASYQDLIQVEQTGPEIARGILDTNEAWACDEMARCQERDVQILTPQGRAYPHRLLETPSPRP